jgi:3-hydroxyacyl-[acyl-carrier-protein] dehydratase
VSGVAHVGDRVHGEVQLLFARMGEEMAQQMGARLFRPRDLQHWLELVGIFEVGVKQDGTRLKRSDYPLEESELPPAASLQK